MSGIIDRYVLAVPKNYYVECPRIKYFERMALQSSLFMNNNISFETRHKNFERLQLIMTDGTVASLSF